MKWNKKRNRNKQSMYLPENKFQGQIFKTFDVEDFARAHKHFQTVSSSS